MIRIIKHWLRNRKAKRYCRNGNGDAILELIGDDFAHGALKDYKRLIKKINGGQIPPAPEDDMGIITWQ